MAFPVSNLLNFRDSEERISIPKNNKFLFGHPLYKKMHAKCLQWKGFQYNVGYK